ncbi:UNVERIFIED_CONTAM: C-terminal binding protein [Microbacterium sp. SLM126]
MSHAPTFTIAVAHQSIGDEDEVRTLIGDRAEVRYGPLVDAESARILTDGADALIVTLQGLDAERIAALSPSVQVIGRAGVGLDTIDLAAAEARRIAVVNQPTYATAEVATHAAAMLLAVNRRIVEGAELVRAGWGLVSSVGSVAPLQDRTLGVVGFGAIGRAFAERMRPFFASVLAYDPAAPVVGATVSRSLDELLSESDAVSLHLPLLPQTRGIIGAEQLARMRPGAILVNVSRGGLVDEAALAAALASGHLGGAALDVFQAEPLPDDSPLRTAPNLLLTPHVAWFSDDSSARMTQWTIDDVVAILNGELPRWGRVAVGRSWLEAAV